VLKTALARETECSMKVQCANCGKGQFEITESMLAWEAVDWKEREMGTETHHHAEWEGVCPECKKSLKVMFNTWEYPAGEYCTHDIKYDGAKYVDGGDICKNVSLEEDI
jgi:hypothetical protein